MVHLVTIAAIILLIWNVLVSSALIAVLEILNEGDFCNEYCPYKNKIENGEV